MPTILTHAAIPLAAGLGLGRAVITRRLLALGVVASALPDLDVLAFKFGIPYASMFGHRGLTHSIMFAVVIALLSLFAASVCRCSKLTVFCFIFLATVSHPLLDAMTNGGLGVALFWPYDHDRFFAPWQVIQVSPIGVHFFSERGVNVLLSELCWVWFPCIVLCGVLILIRKIRSMTTCSSM